MKDKFLTWQSFLKDQRLPAALIDLDAFNRNMDKIVSAVKGSPKTIRIATKSIRVPELIQQVLGYGTPFEGVMCYSAEEAAFLHTLKIDDFIIAYPTVQKSDLLLLKTMQNAGAKIALVIDSKDQMQIIHQTLKEQKEKSEPLRIIIEIDMSHEIFGKKLGVLRSPITTEQDIRGVIDASRNFPTLKIVGVMAYEAIVAGLPDCNPFSRKLNPIKAWIRKQAIPMIAKKRASIPVIFSDAGIELEVFNGGGTGSLDSTSKENVLTEVTVGSGLLCSHLFDYYSNLNVLASLQFEPAAFFALQVTRYPGINSLTCHGGGYIASGECGQDRAPIPVFPPGLKLVKAEGCGEVQTPLRLDHSVQRPLLGEAVFFRHAKAGELAEHFNEYYIFSNGKLISKAKTYRGLGFSFLG